VHAAPPALPGLSDAWLLRDVPGALMPLSIEVAAGLIRDERGRYLVTQRRRGSHLAGLWEFPGGKLEPGEAPAAALRRELTEELSATFTVGDLVETVRWEYPERVVVLHFFDCRLEAGPIVPTENQAMTWVRPDELRDYDFPPADQELIRRLAARG
jgi:8-oxo-dGTP diphosphatase